MHPLLVEADDLVANGQIGAAIDMLERAVALGDEDVELCKHIARLCLSVNEVRAFANWCHEAMRVAPHDAEPHLMIARVLVSNKRWDEAVEALDQALGMPTLTEESRAEALALRAEAAGQYAAFRRANPGFSNL